MPTTLPKRRLSGTPRRQSTSVASERGLLGTTVYVALVFCLATSFLPAEFVLPAMSAIVVVSGLVVGVWALLSGWLKGIDNEQMLDIAGILVLFGFVAAVLCDKPEALRLVTTLSAQASPQSE
jgi:hypothetical protein